MGAVRRSEYCDGDHERHRGHGGQHGRDGVGDERYWGFVNDGSGEGSLMDVTNSTYMMALILAWCGVALLGEAQKYR